MIQLNSYLFIIPFLLQIESDINNDCYLVIFIKLIRCADVYNDSS